MSRVRGVTAATIASGSGSTTTTSAPETASAPSRPKCSSVVVTISSPGRRPSPRTAIPHPSVVELVSATCAGSAPTSVAKAPRSSSRRPIVASKYGSPLRPWTRSRSIPSARASATGRASGPNVPALRNATVSSTGKSARASANVTTRPPRRHAARPGRGRRAPRHSAGAWHGATSPGVSRTSPRTRMWSIPSPGAL